MATGRSCKNYRAWKLVDSSEPSDVHRLYDPEKIHTSKPVKWINYWTSFLLILGVLVLFSFGVLVGYYVRESQKVAEQSCLQTQRSDGFESEKLQAVHNNIMYFMSGQKAIEYYRQLDASQLPISEPTWDQEASKLVEAELRSFGLDSVEIEDQDVVVTYPDPERPNRLEIIEGGKTTLNLTFHSKGYNQTTRADNQSDKGDNQLLELPPFVAFSPSGEIQGDLVFANFGRYIDFLQLQSLNVSIEGAVVLIRKGRLSVAQKVKWAEKFGASGVLLYCDLDICNHGNSDGLFESAADFSGDQSQIYPTIPLQTISMETAMKVLQNYPAHLLPSVWKSFLQISTHLQLSVAGTERAHVKLSVHNIQATRRIRNIVATMFGSSDSDEYVLVGAGRTWYPADGDRDAGSNTAMLLELVHSLSYVHRNEGWKPRRTIKFYSWGGSEMSNAGISFYIENNKHTLQKKAISYIELNLQDRGSDIMNFLTSPSLIGAITNAANRVPDQTHTDLSVAERWPPLNHAWYLSQTFPLKGYHSNRQEFPLVHHLGVPSISVRFGETARSTKISTSYDLQHHFKYHMSAARVTALTLVSLVDNELLSFEIGFNVDLISKLIQESIQIMSQIGVTSNFTDELLSAIDELVSSGVSFDRHAQEVKITHNSLSIRKINEAMRDFEGFFIGVLSHRNFPEFLLCQDEENGSLISLTNAIDEYIITKNRDSIDSLLQYLTQSIRQVQQMLSDVSR